MKRGFTLIEILVVLLIVGILIGATVMNFGAGFKAAQVRDAARSVQMLARHAKAVALLKQRPVVLSFEEVSEDGEFVKSRISLTFQGDAAGETATTGVGMGKSGGSDGIVRTLAGEPFADDSESDAASDADAGAVDDPLMAEPREFEGVRIHAARQEETRRARISIFSNADLLRQNAEKEAKARQRVADDDANADSDSTTEETTAETDKETSFSVVFEANGRCEPFSIAVFKDGTDEKSGLKINVSRFAKVVTEED